VSRPTCIIVQAQIGTPLIKKSSDLAELQDTPFLGWGGLGTLKPPLVASLAAVVPVAELIIAVMVVAVAAVVAVVVVDYFMPSI